MQWQRPNICYKTLRTETPFVTNKIRKDSNRAFRWSYFPIPLAKKGKSTNNWSPPSKKKFYKRFSVLIFFVKILWLRLLLILLKPLDHHAIWLENMLQVNKWNQRDVTLWKLFIAQHVSNIITFILRSWRLYMGVLLCLGVYWCTGAVRLE